MSDPPGKRHIPVYIDEGIYREIKVYAAQTDQTIQQVIAPIAKEFEQSALALVAQIREMKEKGEPIQEIVPASAI